MSMYSITELSNGNCQCLCRIQDGVDRWTSQTKEQAVRSLIKAAKTMNGTTITEKNIHFEGPIPHYPSTKPKAYLDISSLRAGDNIQEEWTVATKRALLDEVEKLRAALPIVQPRDDPYEAMKTEQYGHGLMDGVAGRG